MRVNVSFSGPGGSLDIWFERIADRMIDQMQDVVADAAEEGANITKHHIETRGTMKSGKRGRVETGEMRDSVTSEVKKSGGDVTASFGWIGDAKDYYKYQEQGFNHIAGVKVEGMYALRDAGIEVKKNVLEDMERIIKRA